MLKFFREIRRKLWKEGKKIQLKPSEIEFFTPSLS